MQIKVYQGESVPFISSQEKMKLIGTRSFKTKKKNSKWLTREKTEDDEAIILHKNDNGKGALAEWNGYSEDWR
jgi:hypothetical protein